MTQLEHTRPRSGTRIGSRLRQAKIRASLFRKAPAPVKIERFTLLERVGAGNMGEVYAAYDERLDRKVAIKLVRGDSAGTPSADVRLLREAKTLARLSHPNVVQIYDAGTFEGRVFIAMEFIRGRNMRVWLKQLDGKARRSRKAEILRRFVAAGRGLEAAHKAGLTHRDFKPDNILVGDDGRVVVVDFGLARFIESPAPAPPRDPEEVPQIETVPLDSTSSFDTDTDSPGVTTPEGLMLGTPAYMAPELHLGQPADDRSDQFSFCVALYEALHGERPFRGADLDTLRTAIVDGTIAPVSKPSVVQAPVKKALHRGLARSPDERFADMGKLLDALETRRRRRWQWFAVVALVAIALAIWLGLRGATTSACTGSTTALTEVWNPAVSDQLHLRMLTTSRYTRDVWPRVEDIIKRYTSEWTTMHRSACLANHQGRETDLVHSRRTTCLKRRRVDLREALDALTQLDTKSQYGAVPIVNKLPALDHCADTQALLAAPAPPDDRTRAEHIDDLQEEVSRARSLEHSGRYIEALDATRTLEGDTRDANYPPLLAEVLLLRGRIAMHMGEKSQSIAVDALRAAVTLGLREQLDSIAVEAYARLLFAVRGKEDPDSEALTPSAWMLEAISERLLDDTFVQALYFNNLGVSHMARRDWRAAQAYFERAASVPRERILGPEYIEFMSFVHNWAMRVSDHQERAGMMAEVAKQYEETLGAFHPQTLQYEFTFSSYIVEPRLAYDRLRSICDSYQELDQPSALKRCLYLRGFLAAELGQLDRAGADMDLSSQTVAVADAAPLPAGYALLYRGHPKRAQEYFVLAESDLPEQPDWWEHKDIGDTYLGLGAARHDLGQHTLAIDDLKRALSAYDELLGEGMPRNTEYMHRRALAAQLLARTLVSERATTPGGQAHRAVTGESARALSEQAEKWYRDSGQTGRADKLANWRAINGLTAAAR